MIRKLSFVDEAMYWGRSGRQATVLDFRCSLNQNVDPVILRNAFTSALCVYTNFRITPVIVNGRIEANVLDDIDPVVVKEDGRVRCLATNDTNQLMIYISYEERAFTLHVFHGLSDLHGISFFVKALLKFYFAELGLCDCELPSPDSADASPVYEVIMEQKEWNHAFGRFDPSKHEIFHLPETTFGKKTTRQRVFEIDVPLDPVLALSKKSESSVVPTLQAIIGHTIRSTYDAGSNDIVAYTPVDLRPIFHLTTDGNGASPISVPYAAAMDHRDLGERAMYLRSTMELQLQPENMYAGISVLMAGLNRLLSRKFPVGIKSFLAVNVGRKKDNARFTYGLTYGGNFQAGEGIDPYIQSVTCCAASYSYPLWLVAYEFGGTIRIIATQSFESDLLIKNITKDLAEHFPGTVLFDRDHHDFDEFHLKSLKKIKA